MLPLKAEEEEAQKCHELFLEAVVGKNERVFNNNTVDAVKNACRRMQEARKNILEEREIEIINEKTELFLQ